MLQIDLLAIAQGPAIVIIGLLALLLWVAVQFRNPLALVMWGLSMLTLIMSSLYNLAPELFFAGVLLTVIIVIIGVAARVTNS